MVTELEILNFAFVPLSDEAMGDDADTSSNDEDLDGFEEEDEEGNGDDDMDDEMDAQ